MTPSSSSSSPETSPWRPALRALGTQLGLTALAALAVGGFALMGEEFARGLRDGRSVSDQPTPLDWGRVGLAASYGLRLGLGAGGLAILLECTGRRGGVALEALRALGLSLAATAFLDLAGAPQRLAACLSASPWAPTRTAGLTTIFAALVLVTFALRRTSALAARPSA